MIERGMYERIEEFVSGGGSPRGERRV